MQHIKSIELCPVPNASMSYYVNGTRFRIVMMLKEGSFTPHIMGMPDEYQKIGSISPSTTSAEALVKAIHHLDDYIEKTGDSEELDFLMKIVNDGYMSPEGWIFAPWTGDKYNLVRYRDKPFEIVKRIEQDTYPHRSKDVYSVRGHGWTLFHRFILQQHADKLRGF